MSALPLISERGLDDVLAWCPSGPVTVREFLADAHALAARLPEGGWPAAAFLLDMQQHWPALYPGADSPALPQRKAG